MAKTFHLTIAKVGENLFDGEAQAVTLPGVDGVFTVMAHHEPLVSELKKGTAVVKTADGTRQSIEVDGGVAEISSNQATVLL
ncbi:MAG TPA: F0F1 ATP synthase subunit epsilon [Candidatus Paceibacterota bacterium]|nr:F0F1 ATP synthase subunit epsilon [Candidatus Paceibacterota bacterium]